MPPHAAVNASGAGVTLAGSFIWEVVVVVVARTCTAVGGGGGAALGSILRMTRPSPTAVTDEPGPSSRSLSFAHQRFTAHSETNR
jgi:hypothetical protein